MTRHSRDDHFVDDTTRCDDTLRVMTTSWMTLREAREATKYFFFVYMIP